MKRATTNDIADALGISRVSVWKVLSGKSGTSPKLRRKVIAKAIELGYPVSDELTDEFLIPDEPEKSSPISIAVAVSRPETSVFWMEILHELAKEAAMSNINLLYTYLPPHVTPDYQLPPQLTEADGFVVMNVYNEEILHMLCSLSTPKVFMDTVPSIPFDRLNGSLLLIEGRSGVEEITNHLIEKGISEIGFIGDIEYAQTNYERYYGYLHAMKKHGLTIQPGQCLHLTTCIGGGSYGDEISGFLDSCKKLPDAFICVSDFVADILYHELTKRGYQIPKDIAISGFDGNKEFTFSSKLTTVEVNTRDIGKQLAFQLFHRIQYPDLSRTITYICPTVRFSESTDIRK